MTPNTLTRETLSDQIAKQLLDYIASENLEPGSLLPSEIKLADDFRVSRSVVREALRSMAAQGAIEVLSGKGAVVRPVDDKLLRIFFRRAIDIGHGSNPELMEIRKPLEVQSAMLAAQRRLPEEAASILSVVAEMRARLGNLEATAQLDVEFHLLVAAAAHNQLLYHLINSIRVSLREVVREGLHRQNRPEQLERIQVVHETIAQAIERGNCALAAEYMTIHFDEAMAALAIG
jgi:DNA-binding FadR family transcriptional regulator